MTDGVETTAIPGQDGGFYEAGKWHGGDGFSGGGALCREDTFPPCPQKSEGGSNGGDGRGDSSVGASGKDSYITPGQKYTF